MDGTTRRRLEGLRRRTRDGRYVEHDPVVAQHSSGALTLTVDCTGWVTAVEVGQDFREAGPTLPELVAETYGVAELRRGLAAAATGRVDEDDLAHGRAIAERRVRVTVNRYPAPARVPALPPHPDEVRTASDGRRVYEAPAPLRGSSRDGELTVHASYPMGFSRLEVDHAWLVRASASDVRYALREAFAAAYAREEW